MRHFVLPDVQLRPGDCTKFLTAIGNYLVHKKPDVVVCLGDFADMPSLSSYDQGKKSFEGRRYKDDVECVKAGMTALLAPLKALNEKAKKSKEKLYRPRMVMLLGNHCDRINRAVNNDAKLEGVLSTKDLGYEADWEVHPFLEVVIIDGVCYSHFFVTGVMGRPCTSAQAILNKKHQSCIAGHQQGLQIATSYRADGKRLTAIIAGSCLHPDHKVLTADLRYVPLRSLAVGDKVVSFDEGCREIGKGSRKAPRRYRTGTVQALRFNRGEMFDVTLSSGKVFRVTKDHLWFTKNSGSLFSWKTTEQLRCTKDSSIGLKGGGTRIVKLLDEFVQDTSWESGWLAGMYCGEGSLYTRKTTGGSVIQLGLSQSETHNPATCRRLEAAHKTVCGVDVVNCGTKARGVNNYRITGGARNIAKTLGTIRPPRMLDKFKPEHLGGLGNKIDHPPEHIVSVVSVGEDEFLEIAIDEKTMIVEGYGHHNCYEHAEDYLGPQGNRHWRGLLVLNSVNDGEFDLNPVPLSYIKERYV